MESKREYLFGLIFTVVLFLIMDQFASEASLFIRAATILFLLLIGRFLFRQLFTDDQ